MSKSAKSVSVIGGADGPTTIFLAGSSGKKSLRQKMREYRYRKRKARAEAQITPAPHTIEEVIIYISKKYKAEKLSENKRIYRERRQEMREALIVKHRPELLGETPVKPDFGGEKPEEMDEAALREFWKQIEAQLEERSKKVQEISEEEFPIAYAVYLIRIPGGRLELEIEKNWEFISASYSGGKKQMKKLEAIMKEIYLYYGVSEKDIRERSERYLALVSTLAS